MRVNDPIVLMRANVCDRMVGVAILSRRAVHDSRTSKHLKVLILEMLLIIQLIYLMVIVL
jgi:hypothetical protein